MTISFEWLPMGDEWDIYLNADWEYPPELQDWVDETLPEEIIRKLEDKPDRIKLASVKRYGTHILDGLHDDLVSLREVQTMLSDLEEISSD